MGEDFEDDETCTGCKVADILEDVDAATDVLTQALVSLVLGDEDDDAKSDVALALLIVGCISSKLKEL